MWLDLEIKNRVKNFMGILFFIFFGFIIVGCSGSIETSSSSSYTGTFTNIYSKLISPQCVSCHAPTKSPYSDGLTGLDLSSAALAYSSLKNGRVSGASSGSACQNITYVNSGNPTSSYVMAVLSNDYATSNFANTLCTPLNSHRTGLVNPSAADIAALRDWIQNGAANN